MDEAEKMGGAPSNTVLSGIAQPLTLGALQVGQIVRVQLPHWPAWVFARVEGFGRRHCQLHGEFIDRTVEFRKLKRSGRESYLFDLDVSWPVSLLELISAEWAPAAGQSPSSKSVDGAPQDQTDKDTSHAG